jgi:hypothetical protein
MSASVTLGGYQAAQNKLGELEAVKKWATPVIRAAQVDAQKLLKTYPPRRNYVRTFKLQASWVRKRNIEATGDHIIGRVRSTGVRYNIFVQDKQRQAAVHRGYWNNTTDDVSEKIQPQFRTMMEKKLRKLTK